MNFHDAAAEFERSLRAANAGAGTVRAHTEGIRGFFRRFPNDVRAWNKHHVRTFLANRRWSQNTRRIRWKGLNAFARFLVEEGARDDLFTEGVPCPPAGPPRKPPRLDDHDFELLLASCPHWTWIGLRNRALLWMLWTSPFRKSEYAALRVSDVQFRAHLVRSPTSKNQRPYLATLFPAAAAALRSYLEKRPFGDEPALWVTDSGEPMTPGALTLTLRRIEERAKAAGFDKHIYFHAFRHNFGQNAVRWGLSTREIADAMGHESEKAATIYTRWVAAEEAHKKIRRAAGLDSDAQVA